jgi:hypothetical protein
MKKVYICGDSFSTPDPEYGPCWVDFLQQHLTGLANIINHSSVSASNLLVSVQVESAINDSADFVIVQGTACTRSEVVIGNNTDTDLMTRFNNYDLVSYSIYRPYRSYLNTTQQTLVEQYQKQFFDLQLAIYRDRCIIENTLQKLTDSQIPFLFDQGGFEHVSFGNCNRQTYFEKYKARCSDVNLWDYGNTVDERPYYHIKDTQIHREVAEYYLNQIKKIYDKT